MRWLWNWEGKCVGYQDDENLWTVDGRHVGRFYGDEIYSADGSYLGEVINGRLIVDLSKKLKTKMGFDTLENDKKDLTVIDVPGQIMYAGHEDFPEI